MKKHLLIAGFLLTCASPLMSMMFKDCGYHMTVMGQAMYYKAFAEGLEHKLNQTPINTDSIKTFLNAALSERKVVTDLSSQGQKILRENPTEFRSPLESEPIFAILKEFYESALKAKDIDTLKTLLATFQKERAALRKETK